MREAVGQTFIVNLILVFFAVISALLIGSLSYSKAFRTRNRIIYVIEKHGTWDAPGEDRIRTEIEHGLREIGYQMNLWDAQCRPRAGGELVYGRAPGGNPAVTMASPFDFCVHSFESGRYYGVTTFMHFNIPLIGGFLRFPVFGQTKPLLNLHNEDLRN